jgi:multidrug transporter EmrE-like cation transporter
MTSTTTHIAMPAPNLVAWVNLVAAISLLNSGNLLLDRVAKGAGIAVHLFLSPVFLLAIACLGSAYFLYVRSLARLPLAVAYPVMVGISLVVVALANYYWLGTPLAPGQLLGILVLFLGVVLISTASSSS